MGSSLNQRAAEFSLCNTLVLLLDLAFKQSALNSGLGRAVRRCDSRSTEKCFVYSGFEVGGELHIPSARRTAFYR